MTGFFKKLLGFMLLLATMGLATCQSLYKVATTTNTSETEQSQLDNRK
jgi:hypothetical protein